MTAEIDREDSYRGGLALMIAMIAITKLRCGRVTASRSRRQWRR